MRRPVLYAFESRIEEAFLLEANVIGDPHLDAAILGVCRNAHDMHAFAYSVEGLARAHSVHLFGPLTAYDLEALDAAWNALQAPLRAAMEGPHAPLVLSDVDDASARLLRRAGRGSVVRCNGRLWQRIAVS